MNQVNEPANHERKLLWIAAVIAVLVVAAYAGFHWGFKRSGWGDSNTWGTFGDYFAGLINPLLGFFTLSLLLATLRVTRQVRDDTKTMMEDQRTAMNEQLRLLNEEAAHRTIESKIDVHRRILQGILLDWQHQMTSRTFNGVVTLRGNAEFTPVQSKPFGELLYDPLMAEAAKLRPGDDEHSFHTMISKWKRDFAEAISLIHELNSHTALFLLAGGDFAEAEFYRARLAPAVRVFSNAGIVRRDVADAYRV
jgi:uncharacterized membrane protein